MEKQPTKNSSFPNLLDSLAIVGAIGGSVASLVSQQVVFAAIPLSLSVALNVVNRRQMLNEIAQNQQNAIAYLGPYIQKNSEQLKQLQKASTEQSQEYQSNFKVLSEQLSDQIQDYQSKFETLSEQLTEQTQQYKTKFETLTDQLTEISNRQTQVEESVEELNQKAESPQKIYATNPNSAEFYYQNGLTHQHSGDTQEAISEYTKAIDLDNNNVQAYYNRGILYAEIGSKKAAVQDLRQAAKLFFDQGDIESYEKARDMSKDLHKISHETDEIPDKWRLVELFS